MSKISQKDASPKFNKQQAKEFWNALSPSQKLEFNALMNRLINGELLLSHINIDDNEQIQSIILEPKDKKSIPDNIFYEFFKSS